MRLKCVKVGRAQQNFAVHFSRVPEKILLLQDADACPLISPQCLFLVWCMAPVSWNGSEMIYRQVIRPFFLKHQTAMDNIVSDLSSKAMALSEDAAKKGEVAHTHMHNYEL